MVVKVDELVKVGTLLFFDKNNPTINHTWPCSGKFKSIEESFTFSIEKLLRNGNKIILIYPTPEIIQNPKRKLFANIPKNVNEIKQFFEDN